MEPKVMIVDDEPDVCEAVNHYLKRRGYCVITAKDGEEALSKFISEKPAVVLLDIRLPGMDGIECLRRIRQINPEALVVMVTCVTDSEIANQAIKSGAIDYITKPFGLDVIERVVTVYLFMHNTA